MPEVKDAAREPVPDAALVTRLLQHQVPELEAEVVRPSVASGSSNWVFRVGEQHAVRLPRANSYVDDLLKEARWLPQLAPELPVPVPDILFQADPSALFPRPWTVVSWVPGDLPGDLGPAQQARMARTLGEFVQRLHAIDTRGLSAGIEHWGYRAGEPVTDTIGQVQWSGVALRDPFGVKVRRSGRAWFRLRSGACRWWW